MSFKSKVVFFLNHGRMISYFGGLLMLIGLVLTPVIIGLPIMLIGWFIVIGSYWTWWLCFIPQKQQEKILDQITKSYKSYQPAINSFGGIIKQMLKSAAITFIILSVITVLIIVKLNL